MYQVIARKYRPQSFTELISQEHVRTTLENAIQQQRIAHGYILSGQRGTGKTTVARIVARCLNCEQGPTSNPCGVCASCREIAQGNAPDVIEIDAASNRGINEMRELRENVRYRPARDRYKVFIIDEAHQITNEAFNALLKTLEEPPEWAVFIMCTTESHKIPTTIASRCQQFSFRSVDFAELLQRMEWICQQEGVTADTEALSVIAHAGEGSVRDSLSALDQAIACCGNTLSADDVRALLGMFSTQALEHVSNALLNADSKRMLDIVAELEGRGANLQHFCRELSRYFRNLLVAKITGADTRLIAASPREKESFAATAGKFSEEDLTRYLQLTLDLFRDLQYSLQPRLHMELGLLRLVYAGRLQSIEEVLAGVAVAPAAPAPVAATAPRVAAAPPPAAPRTGPSPFAMDTAKKVATAPAATPAAAAPVAVKSSGSTDLRVRLHEAMVELGLTFSADAIEHSMVVETPAEMQVTLPELYSLNLTEGDMQKAMQALGMPLKRVKIKIGEVQEAAPIAKAETKPPDEDEVTRRALENPEIRRFQQAFPDSQVRQVRNLKE